MFRVYWDTMLFIYWLEGHPRHAARVEALYARMERRRDRLCTSTLTVGEVLAGVAPADAAGGAERIREFFHSSWIEVLPFTLATAERYAAIRRSARVAPADAVHLATAAEAAVDLFLTNDRHIQKLAIPGIEAISGLDTKLP